MPVIVPPGFGVLSYEFALLSDPEPMVVTIGVDIAFGASGPQDKVDQKADDFQAAFTTAGMVSGWSFLGCVLREGTAGAGSIIWEAPRVHIGTGGGQALPNNCAYLIRKTTAAAGRRNRGRMYLPPIVGTELDVSATGMLDTATRANLQVGISAGFPGDDFVILHDSDGVTAAPAPTPITGLILDRQIATQRRRMRN